MKANSISKKVELWDTLLHMYSQERRRERYSIIFLWKLAQQLVSGYTVEFVQNPRRGRLAVVHPIVASAPASVKRAREGSLQVKGSMLFNLIPVELRGTSGVVRHRESVREFSEDPETGGTGTAGEIDNPLVSARRDTEVYVLAFGKDTRVLPESVDHFVVRAGGRDGETVLHGTDVR